jgi:hypothetical protein
VVPETPTAEQIAADEPVNRDPITPSEIRSATVAEVLRQAEQFERVAAYQQTMADRNQHVAVGLAGCFRHAAKANRRLVTGMREHARRLAR